jgi:hypothetical protein
VTGLRSWIDEPGAETGASSGVCIRGWCFDPAGREIRGVRIRLDSRILAARFGIPRPDVQAALNGPPASAESGFRLCVRLAPGLNQIRLEADVDDQGWTEFHSLTLSSSWTEAMRHPFRMAMFWVDASLGRPRALSRLTPAEQGYVFARLEEKEGEHPLRLAPHYPPRAIAPERFPKARLAAERLPKFTIVTPSYQQAAFLESAIRSVLDQEGVRLELIVQDGGSTDGSVDILRRYSNRLKYWASGSDNGQADAIARGFAHMEAGLDDVMGYLNSDDALMPGALRFVAEYFARHPSVDAVYGHRVLIDEEGREVGRWFAPRRSCDDLRLQDLIPQETLFWRKRIWDRVGGVDRSFQFAVDWDLLLRFTAAGARIVRLPWFLGIFRLHPNQKSQARMGELGGPEMDRLRERSLGHAPAPDELVASMRRAQIESTLLRKWMRRGWRI